jgi:hypothetical protein
MLPNVLDEYMEIQYIVVHVGFNDIMKGSSEQLKLIDSLIVTNKRPIISGPVPSLNCGIEHFSSILSLHNWLHDYCTSMGVTFIDNFEHFWKQNTFYKEDGMHPNHFGSRILLQHYNAALR